MILILGIPILLIIIMAVYIVGPWLAILLGIQLEPNPLRPEVTYGEFPFRLEYEVNGQRMVVEDTLICEYDGIGADEGRGKYRKWKERLASGHERVTLRKVDETKEIYYSPGSASYYMDDLENSIEYQHGYPDALIIEKEDRITSNRLIRADQLLKEYNIKLISWEASQPIRNNFSKK
ncbi:hypothetical protein D3C74_303400 [compost metagenome]